MGLSPFHTLAPELFASPPSTHPAAKDGFMQTMPPRASLTSSFSVTDANNEVVCPLKNNDGSNCRKRCLGVSVSPNFSLCVGRSIGAPLLETPTIAAVRRFYRAKRPAFHVYLSLLTLSARFETFMSSYLTLLCAPTGETLSFHAGAYPSGASEQLHSQAPGHRRELYLDGHHPSGTASSDISAKSNSISPSQW